MMRWLCTVSVLVCSDLQLRRKAVQVPMIFDWSSLYRIELMSMYPKFCYRDIDSSKTFDKNHLSFLPLRSSCCTFCEDIFVPPDCASILKRRIEDLF